MMNRSEKQMEERIKADLLKNRNLDPDVAEDRIIQLEQENRMLKDEINKLNGLLRQAGKGKGLTSYSTEFEWGSFDIDTSGIGGTQSQPGIRLRG